MNQLLSAPPGRPTAPPDESYEDTGVPTGARYAALKRPVEVAVAALVMILTAPVFLLAVALVKLTSRGPAFYSQERLGRGGVPFRIYKIRTMAHDCERHSGAVWATRNDPRVFPVGRVLRRLHIDELPQLFNVLRGDMGLIGPRPERPGITIDLTRDIPGYADRLAVRPGVSGLAQVQFPADTDLGSVCRKLVADITYVRTAGPVLDLRVAFATVLYILHLPLSWRRAVLGPAAEPATPPETPGFAARLAAVYELPQKPNRTGAVQGLRGVAASLVFLAHFLTLFGAYLGGAADGFAARTADAVARHGTDLFLLISGFLIYGMCVRRPLDYGGFLRDRAWRIYPAFLCVFALYLGLSVVFPAESKIPAGPWAAGWYLLENLALLPGLTGTPAMIVVTWTLGYELALYVTLPLVVRFTGMRSWPAPRRVAFLLAAWAGYLAYCWVVSPGQVRLGAYFAACLAYEAVHARGRRAFGREGVAVAAAAVGLGLLVLLRAGVLTAPGHPGLNTMLRAGAAGAALFAVAWLCFGGGGGCGRLLSWTPLRWVGNMSYSFYLTHGLVLKAAALAAAVVIPASLKGPGLFWVALLGCYLGAVAAATALFVVVEKRVSFARRRVPVAGDGVIAFEAREAGGTADTVCDLGGVEETTRHPAVPAPWRDAPVDMLPAGTRGR